MNNPLPSRMQEYILWPLMAICVVLGAVSGGTERALYFLAAIFLFALSRQQSGDFMGIIGDIQKRLVALSRELVDTTGAIDRRVVLVESELKRLGADIELLRIPPPRPAYARAFATGVLMLIVGCCLVFLLLRSDIKNADYRLSRYESALESAQERLSMVSQRGDEMLNRVNLTEGRLEELSGDVKDRMISALAQCLRPSWNTRQVSSTYKQAAQPKAETVSSSRSEVAPVPATGGAVQLVNESAGSGAGISPSAVQETLPAAAVSSGEPRASAAFKSFRQEQ